MSADTSQTVRSESLAKPRAAHAVDAVQPAEPTGRQTAQVQGLSIDVISWDDALARMCDWAERRESRVIAICNAHSVVTARHDPAFRAAVEGAAMATADGTPVAWTLRRLGYPQQERINGPDLMLRYCALAAKNGQKIFLYGNEQATVKRLIQKLLDLFPALHIAGSITPPFRAMTVAEDNAIVNEINDSGAQVVFVSLGCPKQEKWMAEHAGRIQAVMVGVGAAFDYHAGTVKRAPLWMQRAGLEWFYRLASEPRRLWRRYLVTNSAFVVGAISQMLRTRNE